MSDCPAIDARAALDFLQSSGIVNLTTPLDQLVRATATLGDVAGYVLAWEKYVLVVSDAVACPQA